MDGRETLDKHPERMKGLQAPVSAKRYPLGFGLAGLLLATLGLCMLFVLQSVPAVAAQQAPSRQPAPGATPAPTLHPNGAGTREAPVAPATDVTPTTTITPTSLVTTTTTSTPTSSPTLSPIPTDLATQTASPTPSPTASPTPTPTLIPIVTTAATVTPTPIDPVPGDSEGQWGTVQTCTEILSDALNSTDRAFNGAVASCGPFGQWSAWTYTSVEDTTATMIHQVLLDIRLSVSDWSDDPLLLEVNAGYGWETVASLAPDALLQETLTTLVYDVSEHFITQAEVNAAQIRLVGAVQGTWDGYTIYLDGVRLSIVEGIAAPAPLPTTSTLTPTPAPSPTPTLTPTPTLSPTPTSTAAPLVTPTVPSLRALPSTPDAMPTVMMLPTISVSVTAVLTITSVPVPEALPQRILAPVPTPVGQSLPLILADAAGEGDPHADYTATTSSCASCHRSHTADGPVLRQAWAEEAVCLSCHAAAGPGTNVAPAFTDYGNSTTRFFTHDVYSSNAMHSSGETGGSAYGGPRRHVECEDCHEPHESRRGLSSAPMLQHEMNQVSGVDPVWTATGGPAGFTWLDQAEREYQVCFKCHSSYTSLPSYIPDGWNGQNYTTNGLPKLTYPGGQQVPDSRDMAREFNPYNASFHPVAAPGRNQTIPPGSFVSGWSSSSLVYCSSCHTNPSPSGQGGGPHGSSLLHLLTGGSNYQTSNSGSPRYAGNELCFRCHNSADYIGEGPDTNFRKGSDNLHGKHRQEATCYACHDTHGSEQLHLINLDISGTNGSQFSLLPGYDGLPTDSQTFWQINASGTEKTCWIVCHGKDHRDKRYQNYSD